MSVHTGGELLPAPKMSSPHFTNGEASPASLSSPSSSMTSSRIDPAQKLTTLIAALPSSAMYTSLEFFPPKTVTGFSNLRARLDRMNRTLSPAFITVTWGAGGSTAEKSLELAALTQAELGITTCLHLTCTNMRREVLDRTLTEAKRIGVRNLLALRGDKVRVEYGESRAGEEENGAQESEEHVKFEWAIDLVRYIRKTHGDYFCIGVAAYPEGHSDESHPQGQSLEADLPYLVEKVKAGADFIMTQLFFNTDAYETFETRLRGHESGVFRDLVIIPGMMPIQNYQILKRTAKLSHAKIPEDITQRMDAVKGDDEMVKKVGVEVVSEIVERVRRIKAKSTKGPHGFHFYTLNLEKAVSLVLERSGLLPPPTPIAEKFDCAVEETNGAPGISINGIATHSSTPHQRTPDRRTSSVGSDTYNRVISDLPIRPSFQASSAEAGIPGDTTTSTRANNLAISEGEGQLGREATWDDFPNGRWGDARSPAYGEIDGYGVSLHMSVASATRLWGHPTSRDDITQLFARHLRGELEALPWSEEGLGEETAMIRGQLLRLVLGKGWWSVASQPAVNGVRSDDAVVGWGPRGGFVFQKAFVELFVPETDYVRLKERLQGDEEISFLAANCNGDFECSATATADAAGTQMAASVSSLKEPGTRGGGETNAVTWGVFPGKEIVTPTIIEEVSFRAWAEEAFGIWREWERVFDVRTDEGRRSRGVVGQCREGMWLVNVIHHAFVDAEALWELLAGI